MDIGHPDDGRVLGIETTCRDLTLVGYLLLFHTRFGRYTQSIGSNEHAVELVDIPVRRHKAWIYVLKAVCCAIGAAVLVGRLNGVSPQPGLNYERHIFHEFANGRLAAISPAVRSPRSSPYGPGSASGFALKYVRNCEV